MLLNGNIELQGEYVANVYSKDGTLKQSIGPYNNFITQTGLSLISKFAIADCFRYVSLGSGNGDNSITADSNKGTYKLETPLSQFAYIGGRTSKSDPGHLTSQYNSASFTESDNTVTLSRGWKIPTGLDNFTGNYIFKEFMLSPGRPALTGFRDEGSPMIGDGPTYSLCHCMELDVDKTTATWATGPDYADVAYEYFQRGTPICSATGAFVRVVKDISVSAGDHLILNYSLRATIDSGINIFAFKADNSRVGKNWSTGVSGCSKLLHHGLKLISPGTISVNGPWDFGGMPQPSESQIGQFDADSNFGESFVSSWGCPLEPYLQGSFLNAYISTDWLQFAVNKTGGGASETYQGKSGLMYWRSNPYTDAFNGFPFKFANIRQPHGTYGSINNTPGPGDFRFETTTPSETGHNIYFHPATRATAVAVGTYDPDSLSRSRSVTRNFEFGGRMVSSSSNMIGAPIRNVVLSYYRADKEGCHIPYFDVAFTDTGMHGTPRPDVPLPFNLDTGDNGNAPNQPHWYYLEEDAKLTLLFRETWSSPCDSSVEGCDGYVA